MEFAHAKKHLKPSAKFILKTILACLVILLPLFVQIDSADAETFRYRYYSTDTIYFEDMIPVSGGGYLGVGRAFNVGGNDTEHDAIVTRFDQNGQVLWSRNYTFPGRYADDLRSAVETIDGDFIATGRVVLDGVNEHGNPSLTSAVLILKVDANGNLIWDKLIQNYSNCSSYGARIKATTDGNFVIVGQAPAYQWNEQHSVYTYVANGALITKIDTDGNEIFSRTHYGDWKHSWHWSFNDVVQDSEGNYYAIGYAGTEAYSEAIGWGGMLLAKINAAGNMVWAKKNDYAQDDEAVNVADYGQRILISGSTLYVGGATYASHLSSFSLSGTRHWTKQYACQRGWDTSLSGFSDFIHSGDGNFFAIMTGACQNIAKISPQGAILWSKYSSYNYNFRSLSLESTGVIVGGWSLQDYTADNGDYYGASAGSIDKLDTKGNTCHELWDISITIADIEMLTNTMVFNSWSRSAVDGNILDFSGPSMVVETVCNSGGNGEDNDGDGVTVAQGDCNDNDNTVYPGAVEICGDGIDQDCDGSDLACGPDPKDVDDDGDGYSENQGDCNDSDRGIYPGATEICEDGIDQDCDGSDMPCMDPPSKPGGVTASDGTYSGKVVVAWEAEKNATTYDVYRADMPAWTGAKMTRIATSLSVTAYDDTGAISGRQYYYWVKAKNSGGASKFSAFDTGYHGSVGKAPDRPTDADATDGTIAGHVKITWAAISDALVYEIWRADIPAFLGGKMEKVGTSATTSYEDSTAANGNQYYYWIKARNSWGVSRYSLFDTGYVGAKRNPPAAPTGVDATDGFPLLVTITWDDAGSTDIIIYEIWRAEDTVANGGKPERIGTADNDEFAFIDTTMDWGQTYHYWVKARDSWGASPYSKYDTGYCPDF